MSWNAKTLLVMSSTSRCSPRQEMRFISQLFWERPHFALPKIEFRLAHAQTVGQSWQRQKLDSYQLLWYYEGVIRSYRISCTTRLRFTACCLSSICIAKVSFCSNTRHGLLLDHET